LALGYLKRNSKQFLQRMQKAKYKQLLIILTRKEDLNDTQKLHSGYNKCSSKGVEDVSRLENYKKHGTLKLQAILIVFS
jgi:Tat protein secretion system quality control protein TatD with DNase activity